MISKKKKVFCLPGLRTMLITPSYANVLFENSDWPVESSTTAKLALLQKRLHELVVADRRGRANPRQWRIEKGERDKGQLPTPARYDKKRMKALENNPFETKSTISTS